MNSHFSKKISEIIVYGKEEANRLSNSYIGPEHLLLGMIRDGKGKAVSILSNLNIDLQKVKEQLDALLSTYANDMLLANAEIALSEDANRILRICILEARTLKNDTADTEHMLLAILRDKDNVAASILQQNDVEYDLVKEQIPVTPDIQSGMGFPEDEEDDDEDLTPPPSSGDSSQGSSQRAQTGTKQKSQNDTPALDNFGTDMTHAAQEGRLDPVVGRQNEIERLAQILSRRKKNNPILIGEPGVGKSAIVEGLALRIVQKKVSRVLFDKRVISLDMTSVVAGTKYRGQFEERIRTILNELKKNPDVILFIDEIHNIVGAGSAAGSMDAANMLKPALARGEIQCIGATTLDEYRNNIEKDGALERRFQKVIVEATTPKETLQILENIKSRYEDHHNVNYTPEALKACVTLTDRYITDRNFPDKAIDALDEAGSRVHLKNINVPKPIEEKEAELEQAKEMKNQAVKSQNFELAASYRDQEKDLLAQLEEMKADWEEKLTQNRETVDEEDIARVVSMISGIPVQRMAQAEGVKLVNMKKVLQSKVIGQDEAIGKLTKAILRSRVGLKDPNKPTGTFMFLGPTGVGKTHLAKELAQFMFGSTDALIRIDMSEYMEKFTVSRLVGAPPGYVGYEEGGQLTERVRRKPYSIVLLDEIEKAHPDVFNLLLQVMDEGRLTDSNGRMVDFKNTVIIMTSNVGTRKLKEFGRGVGFTAHKTDNDTEHAREIIKKSLNKTFAPEFLNRIDDIIMFDQLSLNSIVDIIDIELAKLTERIQKIGFNLEITKGAKEYIAKKGYDIEFGARPLKRAIQTYIEDDLSELIASGEIQPGATLRIALSRKEEGGIQISTKMAEVE